VLGCDPMSRWRSAAKPKFWIRLLQTRAKKFRILNLQISTIEIDRLTRKDPAKDFEKFTR
jgi:hypothetical protein